jgi:hypothetical protein
MSCSCTFIYEYHTPIGADMASAADHRAHSRLHWVAESTSPMRLLLIGTRVSAMEYRSMQWSTRPRNSCHAARLAAGRQRAQPRHATAMLPGPSLNMLMQMNKKFNSCTCVISVSPPPPCWRTKRSHTTVPSPKVSSLPARRLSSACRRRGNRRHGCRAPERVRGVWSREAGVPAGGRGGLEPAGGARGRERLHSPPKECTASRNHHASTCLYASITLFHRRRRHCSSPL